MAFTIDENGKVKKTKGSKVAIIKTVEGMKNLNESEISEGMRIIDRTSTSKQNKRKRMGNFLNDVTGRNLI
tara:strand:- start:115 stop:327 length:213 start_codon:yes stop_codon:yes gene_type:complete